MNSNSNTAYGIPQKIFFIYSFIIGLGTYDPVFGRDAAIGIVEIALVLLAFCCILYCNKSIKIALSKAKYPFLLAIIISVSTFIYSITNSIDFVFNHKLIGSVLSFFFIYAIINNDGRSKIIEDSLLFFTLGVCLIAIFAFIGIIPYEFDHNMRLSILGENTNSTSAKMVLAALFIVNLFILSENKYKYFKFILLVPLPILVNNIIQSGSRGSFLILLSALIIAFIYSFVSYKKNRKYILGILIIFISGYSFIFEGVVNSSTYKRLSYSIEEQSIGAREEIWKDAIEIGHDNPIIGVGEIGYKNEMLSNYNYYVDTHNMFIYIYVTGGILACIPLLLFYKELILSVLYFLIRQKNLLPFILLFFATFLALKTGGALYSKNIWYYFALIASFKKD